jgi:hypothetical protein
VLKKNSKDTDSAEVNILLINQLTELVNASKELSMQYIQYDGTHSCVMISEYAVS